MNVIVHAIVHANTSGAEPTWDDIVRVNEEGDAWRALFLDALRAAGYVVTKN